MPRTVKRAYPSLRAWLEATGTRQEDLAKKVGLSPTHLSNVVCRTRNCSLPMAIKLSRITNVPVELIVADAAITAKS